MCFYYKFSGKSFAMKKAENLTRADLVPVVGRVLELEGKLP